LRRTACGSTSRSSTKGTEPGGLHDRTIGDPAHIARCVSLILAVLATAFPAGALGDPAVPAPTAAQFAQRFLTLANAFAGWQGYRTRVVHPDCIEASPSHYMCAYATKRPGGAEHCRLMQAEWMPRTASLIRVTLAGRVPVCSSLGEALRSLRS
jgi:hypothetical protein